MTRFADRLFRRKMLLALGLVVLVVMTAVFAWGAAPDPAPAVQAAWNGLAASGFAGGTGSAKDPYRIATAEQLIYFRNQVNGGSTFEGEYIVLTANIDLISTSGTKQGFGTIGEVTGVTTEGVNGKVFQGVFDARIYEIKNLYWNGGDYRGLFGYIGEKGKVYNVTVSNVELISTGSLNGTIAAVNRGLIDNCVVASGTVKSAGRAGGIVGFNYGGMVRNSINWANVSANGNSIVGNHIPGINNVEWLGSDFGGIAGVMTSGAVLDQCANYGNVTGSAGVGEGSGGTRAGGLAGLLDTSTISDSYFIGSLSNRNTNDIGGFTGSIYNGTVKNCYFQSNATKQFGWDQEKLGLEDNYHNNNFKTGSEAAGSLNNGVWKVETTRHNGYPYLINTRLFDSYAASQSDLGLLPEGSVPAGYNNTNGTPISSADDFYAFRNAENTTANYYLTQDITVTYPKNGNNIVHYGLWYGGTFDGNGHTITFQAGTPDSWCSVMRYSRAFGGFFASTINGGTVKNLKIVVEDSYTTTDLDNTEVTSGFGVIAGDVSGATIDNVSVEVKTLKFHTECNEQGWPNRVNWWGQTSFGGLFGTANDANNNGVTIRNTSVTFTEMPEFRRKTDDGGVWSFFGGLIGNIKNTAAINIQGVRVHFQDGAKYSMRVSNSGHFGGMIGETYRNGTVNISDSFYDFDGALITENLTGGYKGKLIAAVQSGTTKLNNIYYGPGAEASAIYVPNGGTPTQNNCYEIAGFDGAGFLRADFDPQTPGMMWVTLNANWNSAATLGRAGAWDWTKDWDGMILVGYQPGTYSVRMSTAQLKAFSQISKGQGSVSNDLYTGVNLSSSLSFSGQASGIVSELRKWQTSPPEMRNYFGTWRGGVAVESGRGTVEIFDKETGEFVWATDGSQNGNYFDNNGNLVTNGGIGHLIPGTYVARLVHPYAAVLHQGYTTQNWYDFETIPFVEFTIAPKTVTVEASASCVYGDKAADADLGHTVWTEGGTQIKAGDYTFTTSDNIADIPFYLTFSVAAAGTSPRPAGSYPISVSTSSPIYSIGGTAGNYVVSPKTIAVTIASDNKTYGDSDPKFTWSTTDTLPYGEVAANVLGITLSRDEGEDVKEGGYAITGSSTNGNYAISWTDGTLTIDPKAITVTINDKTQVYGDPEETLTCSVGGLVNGDTEGDLNIHLQRAEGRDVAEYPITGTYANANYTVTFTDGVYTITARPIAVTIASANKTYGDSDPTFTWSTADTLPYGEVAANVLGITLSREGGEAVKDGGYAITGSSTNGNYAIRWTNGTLTIDPKAIDVTIDDKTQVYGNPAVALTAQTEATLPYGDLLDNIVSLTREAGDTVKEGGYAITGKGVSDNYNVTFKNNGVYTITARPVTVTLTFGGLKEEGGNYYWTYGDYGEDGFGTGTATITVSEGGLVSGDSVGAAFTVTQEGIAATLKNVGTYTFDLVLTGDNAFNYTLTKVFEEITGEGDTRKVEVRPLVLKYTATTPASFVYNQYTADTLPKPSELGAKANLATTLPYGDAEPEIVLVYTDTHADIVSWSVGEHPQKIRVEFTEGQSNYSLSADSDLITLIIEKGTISLALDESFVKEYTYAAGLSVSFVDKLTAKDEFGKPYVPQYTAKLYFDERKAKWFEGTTSVGVPYVPSVDQEETFVTLTLEIVASDPNYIGDTLTETITLRKGEFDLSGVTFKNQTFTYDGTAHEMVFAGLPIALNGETLSGSVVYPDGADRVNHTPAPIEAQLVFTVSGKVYEGITYYNYEIPAPLTATMTIDKAIVDLSQYGLQLERRQQEGGAVRETLTIEGSSVTVVYYAGCAFFVVPDAALPAFIEAEITGDAAATGAGAVKWDATNQKALPYRFTVTFRLNGANDNYEISNAEERNVEVTVEQRKVTLSPDRQDTVYNGEQQIPSADLTNWRYAFEGVEGGELDAFLADFEESGTFVARAESFASIGTVEAVNAGIYAINGVYTPDSGNYNYAVTVNKSQQNSEGSTDAFVIAKAQYGNLDNVTFDGKTVVYDGSAYTIVVSALPTDIKGSGVEPRYSVTQDGTAAAGVVFIDAGMYAYVAIWDDPNYEAVTREATLTIQKATFDLSVVRFEDGTFTYDGRYHSLSVSSEQPLPDWITVSYSSNNSKKDVGALTVSAELSHENPNYNSFDASDAQKRATLTIIARPIDVTILSASKVYGDDDPDFVWEIGEGLVEGDDLKITVSRDDRDNQNVGTYALNGTSGNGNYAVTFNADAVLTIGQRDLVIDLNSVSKVYRYPEPNPDPDLTFGIADGYRLYYEDTVALLGVTLSRAPGETAGNYEITATLPDVGNYRITVGRKAVFTIAKADVTIDVEGIDKDYVYNGKPFRIEKGATHNNTDEGAVLIYPDKEFRLVADSGEYTVRIAETANYKAQSVTFTVTIVRADVAFDFGGVGQYVYNGSLQTVTGVTHTNTDAEATLEYRNHTFTDVPENGILTIEVSIAQTANFNAASATFDVTVDKATYVIDIAFDDQTVSYHGDAVDLLIAGELPEGVTVRYTGNGNRNRGVYVVVAEFEGDGRNYHPIPDRAATLTILPASLSVTIDDQTSVYGDALNTLTYLVEGEIYSQDGVKDDPMIRIFKEDGLRAGEYAITGHGGNANYDVTFESAVYRITPREATLTANEVTSVYGDPDTALTFVADNVLDGDLERFTGGLQREPGRNVGRYAISSTLANPDYTITFVAADYIVLPREVTVTLRDQSGISGEDVLSQSAYDITDGNVIAGDTLGLRLRRAPGTTRGEYPITATYSNQNYLLDIIPAIYYLSERAVITFTRPSDFVYDGNPFSISASINSGTALIFTVNGVRSDNFFDAPGNYSVRISAAATDEYVEPIPVSFTFTILAAELIFTDDQGGEIIISLPEGFMPGTAIEVVLAESSVGDTIQKQISTAYAMVEGYDIFIVENGVKIPLGEYVTSDSLKVRIKLPSVFAEEESVWFVGFRGGKAELGELTNEDGYVVIEGGSFDSVIFVSRQELSTFIYLLIGVVILVAVIMTAYFLFRRKTV